MDKLNIIIPAYNEEKRIAKTLDEYGKFFINLKIKKLLNSEIIVVINNTQDKTEEIVKKYQKKYKIIRYLNFKQGGKGFAISEGFKNVLKRKENSLIGFTDADCSTKPEELYKLYKNIENFDGIIGSRWLKLSIIKTKQKFIRRIMSRSFNLMVRTLFLMPYRDTQCGAKIFKKEALKLIIDRLNITQWSFDVNILYELDKKNLKIKEFPIIWQDDSDSRLNITKVPFEMFFGIIRLRLINSPLKFLINAYDKLPKKLKIHLFLK